MRRVGTAHRLLEPCFPSVEFGGRCPPYASVAEPPGKNKLDAAIKEVNDDAGMTRPWIRVVHGRAPDCELDEEGRGSWLRDGVLLGDHRADARLRVDAGRHRAGH